LRGFPVNQTKSGEEEKKGRRGEIDKEEGRAKFQTSLLSPLLEETRIRGGKIRKRDETIPRKVMDFICETNSNC
jgi:hypothetical protein